MASALNYRHQLVGLATDLVKGRKMLTEEQIADGLPEEKKPIERHCARWKIGGISASSGRSIRNRSRAKNR